MVDDNIFREVDEELRRERAAAYWDKYGVYVLGGALAFVAIVAGFLYYQKVQIENRQQAGDQFIEALQLVSAGKEVEAIEKFEDLANNGTKGYQLLARLNLAAQRASGGQTAEAAVLYKKITVDPSADKILRDYAKLNLAFLRLDDGATYDETLAALSEFVGKGVAWRATAVEVVALAALKEGKLDIAQTRFTEIIADRGAPSALRRRAQVMLDVIAGRRAQN